MPEIREVAVNVLAIAVYMVFFVIAPISAVISVIRDVRNTNKRAGELRQIEAQLEMAEKNDAAKAVDLKS